MLSVTLGSLNSIQVPGGKSVLVPLTSVDSHGGPVNYSFSSSNPAVQLSLVSPTSKSIVMNVSGTDSSNVPFTGTIVMHLFEDLAPTTTARIEAARDAEVTTTGCCFIGCWMALWRKLVRLMVGRIRVCCSIRNSIRR